MARDNPEGASRVGVKAGRLWLIGTVIFNSTVPNSINAAAGSKSAPFWRIVKSDYQQFYSCGRLFRMGAAFSGGAVMANTAIDEGAQRWYQNHVRNSGTDGFSRVVKIFGEGKYLIPLSLFTTGIGYILNSKEMPIVGRWGEYTARAYLTGGPALLVLQRFTGASRPGESTNGSRWCIFNDDNGVSGHAFISAVAFLTVARMNDARWGVRYLFYFASTLTALSRINDNAHYTSQAALGWFLAWETVSAVFKGGDQGLRLTLLPGMSKDSYGLCVALEW